MSDYEKALEAIKNLPKFHLGQEVVTPIGKGIIISIKMDFNGLYLSPESSKAIVWFSTENAMPRKEGGRIISFTYSLSELSLDDKHVVNKDTPVIKQIQNKIRTSKENHKNPEWIAKSNKELYDYIDDIFFNFSVDTKSDDEKIQFLHGEEVIAYYDIENHEFNFEYFSEEKEFIIKKWAFDLPKVSITIKYLLEKYFKIKKANTEFDSDSITE